MQIKTVAILALAIPAAGWCAAVLSLQLPSNVLTFSGGGVTVSGCTGGPCAISASGTDMGIMINWSLDYNYPAALIPLDGFPPGNTSVGTMPFVLSEPFEVNDGALGDSIDAALIGVPGWTSNPNMTTFTFALSVTSSTVTSAAGVLLLDTALGSVPTVGSQLALTLDVNCGTQCVTSADPTGTIVGAAITPAVVPEPGTLATTLFAVAALFVWRRRRVFALNRPRAESAGPAQ